MTRSVYSLLTGLFVLTLVSCTGGGIFSPEVDHRAANSRSPQFRTVVRGDTLYSLAWDAGVDFRQLARWNSLSRPYVIKPGQRLRITAPASGSAKPVSRGKKAKTGRSAKTYYRVKKGDTVYSIARKHGLRASEIIAWNGLRKPYRIYRGQRLRIHSSTKKGRKSGRNRYTAKRKQRHDPKSGRQRVSGWVWPVRGRILKKYTRGSTNKGIDIMGKGGQGVRAAASGRVVYQGSGLSGYGKLIIIKHNSDYLSAYAHCATILVKEGMVVRKGQRIATIGRTGGQRAKLHFEVRFRGNPVNPLHYLPKK